MGQCHDAVMLTNWYANLSYYWVLLQYGNRSLRMLLLLAEMVNVLTAVSIFQSIFSMNVRIPFDSTAETPSDAKAPFYILAFALLVFMLWCARIVWDIIFRKRFETVALF
ncbi:unnamed protein product [Phytomonas sp. Hart1]|nr:unnamed protein product [Phytomonas sp. Hart1]|eukprot:CCW67035.1 unnamed protein product [Phytomonas sp. isolate Hart1]